MRMKTYSHFLGTLSYPSLLNEGHLIIDAQNYFYDTYEDSGLPYQYNGECDSYYSYLRKDLSKFKDANVKCIFLFKGGTSNVDKIAKHHNNDIAKAKLFKSPTKSQMIQPIFIKSMHKQILDEMGFDYRVCLNESKSDIVFLATKLNCPVMSDDVEYTFTGVPYVNSKTIIYNSDTKELSCKVFNLDKLLSKYNVTKEHMALLILLTDESIFPDGKFACVLNRMHVSKDKYKRFNDILKQLAKKPTSAMRHIICSALDSEDKVHFEREESRLLDLMCGKRKSSIATKKNVIIANCDKDWFEKGVRLNYIALSYIDMFNHGVYTGSWLIECNEKEDSMLICVEIIRYAFDLLTNFSGSNFQFLTKDGVVIVDTTHSVSKPYYPAKIVVFENGWDDLSDLFLLQHFLDQSCGITNYDVLNGLSEDVKMVIISLVFFAKKSSQSVEYEVYSILVSYLIIQHAAEEASQPKKSWSDCIQSENESVVDRSILHTLSQFTHCLSQLNYLNTLCGRPYEQTQYGRVYNGTLAYKLLRKMYRKDDGMAVVEEALQTPQLLQEFRYILSVYREMSVSMEF